MNASCESMNTMHDISVSVILGSIRARRWPLQDLQLEKLPGQLLRLAHLANLGQARLGVEKVG